MVKVIIVGWPKSGTTWLTRLVAHLLDCPVEGFLYESRHQDIAVEGIDRGRSFVCYKSHHPINQIQPTDLASAKIIYVIRDPRDISLSGRPYFFSDSSQPKTLTQKAIRILKNLYHETPIAKRRIRNKMNNAILFGDSSVNKWCTTSWKDHVAGYSNSNSFNIKYESILQDPIKAAQQILDFIGHQSTSEHIKQSIDVQSFANKKRQFNKQQLDKKSVFLRKGTAEQWIMDMSKRENNLFVKTLKTELLSLGYKTQKPRQNDAT